MDFDVVDCGSVTVFLFYLSNMHEWLGNIDAGRVMEVGFHHMSTFVSPVVPSKYTRMPVSLQQTVMHAV